MDVDDALRYSQYWDDVGKGLYDNPIGGKLSLDEVSRMQCGFDKIAENNWKSKLYNSRNATKGVSKAGNFTTIRKVTAEETNSWWKNVMGYDNPPYKPGTMVEEIKLTKDTTFVRVYDGEVSGMYGGWVMKAEDIAGLTPKQIQDKFALPSLPKYMADVKLTEGTTIRKGIVNPLEGWGNGGGIQYDLMGQRVGEFLNPRELP